MMMNYLGPGLWVVSQLLLLVYFKMDNGSNVCGIEFNYNNKNKKDKKDDLISIIGSDLANNEKNYNAEILRQLFLDFQVKSEEGR